MPGLRDVVNLSSILASEIGALSLDILGKDPKTQEYLQAHHYTLPN